MAQFTESQLKEFIEAMKNQNIVKGSFSHCTARFKGERDSILVESFITTINVYKEVERISDEDAIKGFPLLLEDAASNWWQGVKEGAVIWKDVIQLLRNAYSPKMPAYRIFMEIFDKKQKVTDTTDDFICEKRALLAKLSDPKPVESMMIDMVYGLLHIRIRDGVPRDGITTFQELLTKARSVELSILERNMQNPKPSNTIQVKKRCNFCRHPGHTIDECRKKER